MFSFPKYSFIGSINGFVEGAEEVFIHNGNTEDYHDAMSSKRFEQWLTRVLPLLTPNSVIVLDNASCKSNSIHNILYLLFLAKS